MAISFKISCPLALILICASLLGSDIFHTLNPAWANDKANEDWLSIRLTNQTRIEALENQFRSALDQNDELLTVKTGIEVEARLSDVIRLGLEFVDVRGFRADTLGAISSNFVDPAELFQAYIGLHFEDAFQTGANLDIIAGRQGIDIGSRRLIGRNGFRTSPNLFTGVSAIWDSGKDDTLTLVYLLPQIRRPNSPQELVDNVIQFNNSDLDLQVWGIHYARNFRHNVLAEAFIFGLHDRDDFGERNSNNRQIYTPGGRLFKKPATGLIDYEFEGGIQFGSRVATTIPLDTEELSVFAQYFHGEVGYSFDTLFSPRLTLELDYASGDSDVNDDSFNRFDPLFGPIAGDFGPTNIYTLIARSNLITPSTQLLLKTSKRSDVLFAYRSAFLASATDSFGNSGVIDINGNSGRFAGHQINARLRYTLIAEKVRFEFGGAIFLNGDFFDNAPNANDFGNPTYGYMQVNLGF